MANLSNTAYDTGIMAARALPALVNIRKLMQEERVSQSPVAVVSDDLRPVNPTENILQTIETRFGAIEVNAAEPIVFTRGLLGMHDRQRFALTDFPNARFEQFKLLQSLEDAALSFITFPLELQPDIIKPEDLQRASEDTGIAAGDLAVLFIVTVHRSPAEMGRVRISVNSRAPLLVDVASRQALQYVFPHDRYSVQHMLDGNETAS